jgi:AcrR family transcriptional regulator
MEDGASPFSILYPQSSILAKNERYFTCMPKFSRRPEDRPLEILDAALNRFATNGFANTRMEEVAADAGVTAGTIYRYFPSKDALVDALVDRHIDLSWSRGREVADAYGSKTAREILELLLHRWADALEQRQASSLLMVVVREAPQFPIQVKKYAQQLIGQGCLAIERALRHGIDRGEFPILEIEATARGLAATVVEGTIWRMTFGGHLPPTHTDPIRLAIGVAVRGLPRPGDHPITSPVRSPVQESESSVERPVSGLRIVTLRPPEPK